MASYLWCLRISDLILCCFVQYHACRLGAQAVPHSLGVQWANPWCLHMRKPSDDAFLRMPLRLDVWPHDWKGPGLTCECRGSFPCFFYSQSFLRGVPGSELSFRRCGSVSPASLRDRKGRLVAGRPGDKEESMEAGEWKQAVIWDTAEAEGVGGNNGSGRERPGLSPEGMVAAMPWKEPGKAILTNPVLQK